MRARNLGDPERRDLELARGAARAERGAFDAVFDQVIGYLSDRTGSRWGARLPWMIAGTPLLMVSGYFLYTPPPTADIWYFGLWSLAFYSACTTPYRHRTERNSRRRTYLDF